MDDQEKRKLERKRLRNRMAASKCRQKKIEKIQQLENEVNAEKNKANQLQQEADRLRVMIRALQQHAMEHQRHGCPNVPSTYGTASL